MKTACAVEISAVVVQSDKQAKTTKFDIFNIQKQSSVSTVSPILEVCFAALVGAQRKVRPSTSLSQEMSVIQFETAYR